LFSSYIFDINDSGKESNPKPLTTRREWLGFEYLAP